MPHSRTCSAKSYIGDAGIRNICSVLECTPKEITEVEPIKEGLTSSSYIVDVNGIAYVYRIPGAGTEEIIDRASETFSQGVARDLGIDDTFVYEDERFGWKLSRYIEGCAPFDYHNPIHVKQAMMIARKLHECGIESKWTFNLNEKTMQIVTLLNGAGYELPKDYAELSDIAARLSHLVGNDDVPCVLCHNDFYKPNFLVKDTGDSQKLYLIDWEYSAMSDYASDLGTFICCSDYTVDEAKSVLREYFNRTLTAAEEAHCLAYVALASWYWYAWALYKDCKGDCVGSWQELWHGYARTYGRLALDTYESIDANA